MKQLKYFFPIIAILLICNCKNGHGNKTEKKGTLFSYISRYKIIPAEKLDEIRFVYNIPQDSKYRQKIRNIKYSIKPSRIISDESGKYAEFRLKNIDKETVVTINFQAELFKYDLNIARLLNAGKINKALENPGEYLKDEEFIQSNDNAIISIARQFNAGTEIELLKQIFNYVVSNMEYKLLDYKRFGALYGLNNKTGNCNIYSDLFVALCRARGIPSRTVTGFVSMGDDRHAWSEVYFDDIGWIPFDTTISDMDESKKVNFDNLENEYIYFNFEIKKSAEFYKKYYKDLKYWEEGDVKYSFEEGLYKML